MVRTQGIGFLRDPRRILVAFSRARYGLYVFGRFNNFAHFPEHRQLFESLEKKGLKLQILASEAAESGREEGSVAKEGESIADFHGLFQVVRENIAQ